MIVSKFKESILQIVSEGKLVEQRSSDSAAEELIKILDDVKDDKKYKYFKTNFDSCLIPKNWVWVKLEDICLKITDGTHSTPKYTDSGIPFLSVKDVSSGKISFDNTKYISIDEHKQLYSRCNPEFGDLLITKVGTTGVPVIVDTKEQFSLFVSVALLKFNNSKIYNKYLYYILQSPIVQRQVKENTRGVGNKNWVLDAIKNTILPLPPLEEQYRIVNKIEILFDKLDIIQPIELELDILKKNFAVDMKKSILNAILSKYNNIIELNKIAVINGGYAFKSTNYSKDGIRIIRISDFDEYGIKDDNIVRYKYNDSIAPYKLNNNDIIICMTGGTVGKNVILDNIPDDYYTNQRVATIKVNNSFIPKFVYYCINAPFIQKLIQNSKNSTNDNISMPLIKSFPIPNISIEEQKNVINEIEQFLPLCDEINNLVNEV